MFEMTDYHEFPRNAAQVFTTDYLIVRPFRGSILNICAMWIPNVRSKGIHDNYPDSTWMSTGRPLDVRVRTSGRP